MSIKKYVVIGSALAFCVLNGACATMGLYASTDNKRTENFYDTITDYRISADHQQMELVGEKFSYQFPMNDAMRKYYASVVNTLSVSVAVQSTNTSKMNPIPSEELVLLDHRSPRRHFNLMPMIPMQMKVGDRVLIDSAILKTCNIKNTHPKSEPLRVEKTPPLIVDTRSVIPECSTGIQVGSLVGEVKSKAQGLSDGLPYIHLNHAYFLSYKIRKDTPKKYLAQRVLLTPVSVVTDVVVLSVVAVGAIISSPYWIYESIVD